MRSAARRRALAARGLRATRAGKFAPRPAPPIGGPLGSDLLAAVSGLPFVAWVRPGAPRQRVATARWLRERGIGTFVRTPRALVREVGRRTASIRLRAARRGAPTDAVSPRVLAVAR